MVTTTFECLANLLKRKPQFLILAGQILWGRISNSWIRARRDGSCDAPEQITIMVTDACNLHCKMCQYAYTDEGSYQLRRVGGMSEEICHKVMDETPGRPFVSLTGGEPLLHPGIAGFISYIKNRGRLCTLTTNGWLLAEKAEEICDAGVDLVVVSVDGPRDIHNRIRGEYSFERLVEGLEKILKIPNRPVVFVSTAISNLNHDSLVSVYKLAKQWGVDGMNVNHLWMQPDEVAANFNANFQGHLTTDTVKWEVDPDQVDVNQLAKGFDQIDRQLDRGHMLVTKTPPLKQDELAIWYHKPHQFVRWESTRCAWARLRVWPDGAVKPCRGWVVGNVKDKHIMEIWNGEKFRRFRRLLADHGALPICARCCYMAYR
jgi:MoaA/NifB/PqqE/SkfB family radical SAM enzyme